MKTSIQKVRVLLFCTLLLISFRYLASFTLDSNLTVTIQNSLESSDLIRGIVTHEMHNGEQKQKGRDFTRPERAF
ncbi:MAG: hypothetical protein FD167_50 [bacterium]|nr:MAG: hypothetical protein FD167_50 [bacterium]